MLIDRSQQQVPAILLPPAAYNADNTPATVDLLGSLSATVLIMVGVGGITFSGSNKVEFILSHSDDDVTYAPVTVDDVVGLASVTSGIVRSLVAAHASPSVAEIGYKGRRRYLRLLADFSGTHGTATPMAAVVVRGDLLKVDPV
jgi:hypothetical protein